MSLLLLSIHRVFTAAAPSTDALLMETADYLLLETNDRILL